MMIDCSCYERNGTGFLYDCACLLSAAAQHSFYLHSYCGPSFERVVSDRIVTLFCFFLIYFAQHAGASIHFVLALCCAERDSNADKFQSTDTR
jgi:hypothetical protein